ncbi:arginine--tRNA ligase domain-containing protein, partial [Treponema sp. R6D11]
DGAVWLKSEDKDEVLKRSNGIPTYFAADIAYHYNKFVDRKFDKAINVWGADHHGHVARMKEAMSKFGIEPERLEVVLIQLVRLMRNGEVARMSKRTGKTISLGDLVDEIGVDPARFFFNMRQPSSHFDFDLDLATKKTNDNPVYYVQYAHARISSILKQAGQYETELFSKLEDEEKELISHIAKLPLELKIIIDTSDPSRLAHYSIELARLFHSFYGKHKVLVEEKEVRDTRLTIIFAVKKVISACLSLLGVSSPESM